jgi:hypothetical protein
MRQLLAACALLLFAAPAPAQTPPDSRSGSWYVGVSVLSWTNQQGPVEQPCDYGRFSQGGAFCTSAIGTGLGILTRVGGFISTRASLEVEAALGTSRTGTATYFQYAGHFATDRTDATYVRREQLFSLLLRLHLTLAHGRASVEPVVGGTLAHANDSLTHQVNVVASTWPTWSGTSYPSDESTGGMAVGVSAGVDIVAPVSPRISLVGTARLRSIDWGEMDWRNAPGQVPAGVGGLSVQIGGGLRWGGRRR